MTSLTTSIARAAAAGLAVAIVAGAAASGAAAAPSAPAAAGAAVVPALAGDLYDSYIYARENGLLVNLPALTFPVSAEPAAGESSPLPETIVPSGSAVTFTGITFTRYARRATAVTAAPNRRARKPVLMPRFVGGGLSHVARWAGRHNIDVVLKLGVLDDATASNLLGNYRVARQSLRAGKPARGRITITARQIPATVGKPATATLAPCTAPNGYQAVAADGTAVLMSFGGGSAYGACDLGTNRLFALGDPGFAAYVSKGGVQGALLAGQYAGVSAVGCDKYDNCQYGYQVLDLTTGATVHSLVAGGGGPYFAVMLLALDARGDAVFSAPSGQDGSPCPASGCIEDLSAATTTGTTLLDRLAPGADDFADVAINGDTVTWTNGGVAKSATLG